MLWIHEVHRVRGEREDEFAQAYRDQFAPAIGSNGDARLLWFLHHTHGTGRAYTVVTITATRDAPSWDRLARRIESGDLADWARSLDELRHDTVAKVLAPVPWSPLTEIDLDVVATQGIDHAPGLLMEDTAWPRDGMLAAYLEAARTNYAPSLDEGRHGGRSLLELVAVLRPIWGTGRRNEVVLWQRVRDPSRIIGLLTTEIPLEHRAPGTWMHDALAVRDDWESRLLRSERWSALP